MLVVFAAHIFILASIWGVAFCITFTEVWNVNVPKVSILMLFSLLCKKKISHGMVLQDNTAAITWAFFLFSFRGIRFFFSCAMESLNSVHRLQFLN